jgi:hypothetical protein
MILQRVNTLQQFHITAYGTEGACLEAVWYEIRRKRQGGCTSKWNVEKVDEDGEQRTKTTLTITLQHVDVTVSELQKWEERVRVACTDVAKKQVDMEFVFAERDEAARRIAGERASGSAEAAS